jgi:Carboxypeptidase regulatory-like domain
MRRMRFRVASVVSALVLIATILLSAAFAQQRPVGQIVGSVQDSQGGLVPSCEVKLEDQATGAQRTTNTGSDGGFVILNLQPGTYKVTISAKGFRTAVYSDVKVDAARTTDLVATMEVGDVGETVQVVGGAEVLERSSTTIETTVRGDTIRSLPLNNRDTLDFVLLMPGAQHGGTARQSTFNGLPKGAINITMDGVNVQDNVLKSAFGGGMFTLIRPRLDAIEEVSVSTASAGASQTGDGAIQIQFATRRGTNDYHGLVFWDHRNDALNANTWFNNVNNLRRQRNLLNVFGGNVGGPIWKNKIFFFFNYEEFRLPESRPRENIILTQEASQGIFRYLGTDGVERAINLLNIVGPGFPNTIDPTVGGMLNQINGARGNGAISSFDLFRQRYRFDAPSSQMRRFPTLRLDYQISEKLHWHGVWHYNYFTSNPDTLNSMDPTFPGIGEPAGQYSNRYALSTALQWLVSPTITNEVRFGLQGAPIQFFPESEPSIYPAGLRLIWQSTAGPLGLNSLHSRPGAPTQTRSLPSSRNSPLYSFQDNVSMLRGKHTLSFGGGFNILMGIDNSFNVAGIPTVNFGVIAGDPVATPLSATNLPGISTTDLTNARALYALLTGRISSISGTRNVSEVTKQYSQEALIQRTKGSGFSLYFQDSWRFLPNLTLNYGLGWQFQGAAQNTNDIYTSPTFEDLWGVSGVGNVFKPGTLIGNANPQIDLRPKNIYERDFNNPSPSFGLSWSPRFENSFLKTIFGGQDKSVIRGGYSISYTREGGNHFSQFAGTSPGQTQSITLTGGSDFTPGTVLLRNSLPAFQQFPQAFTFPTQQSLFTFSGNALRTYDPQIRTAYVQSWSFGWQRELDQKTALEIRYVGNHGTRLWRAFNINEVNIFENGFANEFKNAQRNLAINRAAGVTSFANLGSPGQAPLPIFEAAFGARGGQAALPAASAFGNGAFITQLDQGQAGALANSLAGQAQYLCRMTGNRLPACAGRNFNAAGPFAPNFFQVNPDFAGSNVEFLTNGSSSTYNALQIELRRRLSSGLMVNAHYTFSKSLTDLFADSATSTSNFHTLRNPGLNKGPSPWDIRHSFVASWVYELPFGPGRRWRTNNLVLDKVIEGWNLLGIMRLQSGRVFRLTSGRSTVNQCGPAATGCDSGVILKGITISQLQEMFKVRKVAGSRDIFFADADLIGSDGRSNRSILDVPTTPGEFGSFIHLYGPRFVKPDLTLSKKTRVTERVNVEFWAEFFNAFNYQNFLVGAPGGAAITHSIDSTAFGRTTEFFNDLGNQDPGPRMIQFRVRIGF